VCEDACDQLTRWLKLAKAIEELINVIFWLESHLGEAV